MKRVSVVDGHFYPKSKEEIIEFINHCNKQNYQTNLKNIKALIVPHAGYIYSGFTANIAYNLASKENFKRIIVIGPSHRVAFDGASVSTYTHYQTPFGDMDVDFEFANRLKEKFSFTGFNDACHKEHSTETQMPFIAYYFPNTKIIEIVYSKIEPDELSKLVDFSLKYDDTLVVISTDLSHFHNLKLANELDNICIKAIKEQNITKLNDGCEACGIIGVEALLHVSRQNALHVEVKNYTTSYERNQDKSSVVGYVSTIFADKISSTCS